MKMWTLRMIPLMQMGTWRMPGMRISLLERQFTRESVNHLIDLITWKWMKKYLMTIIRGTKIFLPMSKSF
nr:hypothetical protein Iba_chr07cCG5690 [Ipomoea batatas]